MSMLIETKPPLPARREPGPAQQAYKQKIETWPHLVKVEFLAALAVMAILLLWSFVANAPLEDPANSAETPNPAKAPWYFLGLQELLVYFDPWIAGVMLPGLIIIGLVLIPYVDINTEGEGRWAWGERRWALSVFLFGSFLWAALILAGVYFRGPGWAWYWPWEDMSILKPVYEKTWNFPAAGGVLSLTAYFAAGLYSIRWRRPDIYQQLGVARYVVVVSLLLLMLFVPVKIALRLLFHVHYVLVTPWFNV